MSRKWTIPAIFAGLMIATTGAAGAQERYEDAVGDAKGVAPDIVAVTLSEPEGSLVSIDVEFASAPPLGTDGETWTDVLFVGLTAEPDNDLLGDSEHTMYMFGAHATRLPLLVSEGGTLFGPQDMYWRVIDVAVDGSTVSFTLDRKLIGDPFDLYWRMFVGVESEDALETDDASETDHDACPDLDEPPGHYELRRES